jgi:hypothetical protein
MNKPVVFLRIAVALTFIHAILHTVGGVFGRIELGAATIAVQAMKANQVLLVGHVRSFWDFYRGLGLAATISLTSESIVFWQLAFLAKTEAGRVRPLDDVCSCLLGVCRELVYLLLCRAGNRRGPHRNVASVGHCYCQVSLRIFSTNCATSLTTIAT